MPKSAVVETYQYLTGSLKQRSSLNSPDLGRRLRDTLLPRTVREAFLAQVRLTAERGLTAGMLAEASRRLDEKKFIITGRSCWAANVDENDLKIAATHDRWVIDVDELPAHAELHRLIYRETDAGAVLLSQPAAALAVAARGIKPAAELLAGAAADVGNLVCYEFDEVSDLSDEKGAANLELTAVISERRALLLPGHGLLTWGEDLNQAIARAEMVDRWCEIALKLHDTHE